MPWLWPQRFYKKSATSPVLMLKKIMVIAGEASGDFHGARLIQALKELNPGLKTLGIGGQQMRQAGCRTYFDIAELAIIGFTGVLKNLKKLKQVFTRLLQEIEKEAPQAAILVDYPGFNLKLAQELKKRNIPVIYYISPQIWAWWRTRIKTIRGAVDKMLVVFKFEQALYQGYGVDVSFVGHPLLDAAQADSSRTDFLQKLGLSVQKQTVGLLPGSRQMEIERILPILLQSAKIIRQKLPQTQFIVLKAQGLDTASFARILKAQKTEATVCENQTYNFLNACDFALVASGTATLETAIMQRPMLLVYKVSFLNWLIARCLIRLPFIGLVNVAAGEKIVPEFVQFQARPRLIAEQAVEILASQTKLSGMRSDLAKVRTNLGSPGASRRAAEIITNFIADNN
ncbi:MAG: lipid-A-disaccharide synthase [Candidatus Omnitrophica bacterium]|nr:lipid-A-disaccharide synthase [Candidatus Omnitrophota bacterium]